MWDFKPSVCWENMVEHRICSRWTCLAQNSSHQMAALTGPIVEPVETYHCPLETYCFFGKCSHNNKDVCLTAGSRVLGTKQRVVKKLKKQ